MHAGLAQDLASQHSAQLQAAAAIRCRGAAVAGATVTEEPAPSMTQRAGWALVQVGLRLALPQPDEPKPENQNSKPSYRTVAWFPPPDHSRHQLD